MLTIRPTKMLARQLGIEVPAAMPEVPSRVADWCAHSFTFGRRRWLIFCNTASLHAVCAHAKDVNDGDALVRRLVGMVNNVLRQNELTTQASLFENEINFVQWAAIPGRSVLGSMNDLVYLASRRLGEADLQPNELSLWLGKTPMSALGMNNPTRAFLSLRT